MRPAIRQACLSLATLALYGCADYHAAALWGRAIGATLFDRIDLGMFDVLPPIGDGSQVGPTTEGAVAAVLGDIADGTGNDQAGGVVRTSFTDAVAWGHSTVATAIRDCQITRTDGSQVKADGIDYLVHCLEKNAIPVSFIECGKYGCKTLPAVLIPYVDTVADNKYFGGLENRPLAAPAQWFLGTPSRFGYDRDVRTVWTCNLFLCQ